MTYCVGWVHGSTAFLVADSAVTSATPPSSHCSSFGELHANVRGLHVQEALLKLAPIGPNAAIAFAGDVQLSTAIMEFLIAHFSSFDSSVELSMQAVDSTFGPLNQLPEVALMLVSYGQDGPSLARWESGRGLLGTNLRHCSIGSLTSYHNELAIETIEQLATIAAPEQEQLAAVTAIVQSFGVHDNMIEQNVGGAVFGLSVGTNGFQWQEDTGYMLYSQKTSTAEFVRAWVRDNALVVHSSITKETNVLMNSATPDWKKWLSTWEQKVVTDVRSDHFPLLAFLRKEDKMIVILKRTPHHSGLSRIRLSGDLIHIDISQELDQILHQKIGDSQNGKPSFRVIFLRDS